MKNNKKPALAYLAIGLLLVVLSPIISRYLALPDFLKGFLNGSGLMLEVIGLVTLQSLKKNKQCL
ncbi:hypothetical protein [Flavobacterium kingsejongi]|uniref:Uncharacterized protein n=1 Tax=Flavobacterium kingsejongi TaxID=1678728 RepID=A0A2S1LMD2_9FLAO|nr:hypothetical protein [Flavobacterium kingsejongi]AWG24907.1 hypothetical protein FK004_06515 [Flavobacterium kingsejongi]